MAQDKLKTINIKGKQYVQVNERVKAFRSNKEWQGWSIETDVQTLTDDVCVMCARIKDENGRTISTGWAREVRNDATSMVNKTSYVENCETSAVGRALGYLGIGVDENICSANELLFALQAQEKANEEPASVNVTQYRVKDYNEKVGEEFTEILADIEAAESMDQLKMTMKSEVVNKSPYLEAIRQAANNMAKKKGWA